jgi:hypothetical protein
MSLLDEPIPFNVFSTYAVHAARRYIQLMEAQLSQAHSDERFVALERYRAIANPDQSDYEAYVGIVDQTFEEDFRPIMRFTTVVHLFMIFETYVSRHISEIQASRNADREVLKKLRKKNTDLVEAVESYFRNDARLLFFDGWDELRDLAQLRNCIIHNAGIARDSKHPDRIYRLAARTYNGGHVGIEVLHFEGRDAGQPIMIHQQFFAYFLNVLERFFTGLGQAVEAKVWK